MKYRLPILFVTGLGLALASPAAAQTASATAKAEPVQVIGNVPALCAGGTLSAADGAFTVGSIIDTSTGFLLTNLSSPTKIMVGSFCSPRSTITISATPMVAQNVGNSPPTGFSRTVNYTASASGWTTSPASFETGTTNNPGASQTRVGAFTGNIIVAVSNFATGGGNALRMVADPNYLGLVTVTLAVAN